MYESNLILVSAGISGGIIAEIIQYYHFSQEDKIFNPIRALVLILISGAAVLIYFNLVEDSLPVFPLMIHYGVFVTLFIEEFFKGKERRLNSVYGAAAVPKGAILIINGFFPVYGVGCFGAFLVELHALYSQRTEKKLDLPRKYWPLSLLMIFAGGGITVIYGINNVSAVLALQLGASAPLIIKRLHK